MSGDSKAVKQEQSTTAPWAEAMPFLGGVLGQLQGQLGSTGLTGNENTAINQLNANAGSAGQFAPQIRDYTASLFNGGGALDQAGNINQNYQRYVSQTNPLASNTNYDPYSTPGLSDALNTLKGDITNQVNGAFAGAGRDFSGANQMALGRGLSQGLAPLLLGQYNQNIQNQQGAAQNLYGAGNTNAGILAGLQQQKLANQGQGIAGADATNNALNAGANATLQAEALRRNIPVQALGLLANIGIPIAGLGKQSSGTSETTYSPSFWQTLGQAGSAIGNTIGTAGKVASFISDRNAKEDITQVGTLFDGTPVYRFRYIGDPRFQIGLMAQDIEQRTPEAVGMIGPWKAVDYKLATDKAVEVA